MKPQLMLNPKLKELYPHPPDPYLKTWRECMSPKKNITISDLSLKGLCPWFPKLGVSLKGLCLWWVFDLPLRGSPKLRVNLKTESKPKDNIKDIIKTKPTTKANPPNKPKNNIYSKINFRSEECTEIFKNEKSPNYSLI